MPHEGLSIHGVHKVARLARLHITDEQAEQYRGQLGRILEYVERLRSVDLAGVEPMATPLDMYSPLAADEPGPTLSTETLLKMAPETMPPFVKVPKVMGEGTA